jgi:hypothetical protein
MLTYRLVAIALAVLAGGGAGVGAELMPGFARSPFWGEQLRDAVTPSGIHIHVNAPEVMDRAKITTVIFYATPNGNTIAQTLGCSMVPGLDWHYDIQHIAAQIRRLREVSPDENVVLVCVQADEKSWPAWRSKHPDNAALILAMVQDNIKGLPGKDARVALTGHSGGGSMIFGFINSADAIPAWVNRIVFLDANYSFSDTDKHGDKLIAWLNGDTERSLIVIAYDDRNITLDGKMVNGPDAGTYRATERMRVRFGIDIKLGHTESGDIDRYAGLGGRVTFIVHRNPANKILHTVLVGEMNGLLEAMTLNTTAHGKWGAFGTPRAYTKWIQPAVTPAVASPAGAGGPPGKIPGGMIMKELAGMTREQWETVLIDEIKAGNVPAFSGTFVTVRLSGIDAKGKFHTASYQVAPDYLAVGTDTGFVRVPLTPMAAQPLADFLGCSLPTRKMVDQIYRQADVKIAPKPLTENREALATFVQHNEIIEGQRVGRRLGALVGGIKKDVVITNLLPQRAHRVAIYGWHQLNGVPIQPLTTVHVDWYVDYSHGVRLVKRAMIVDGEPRDLWDVLKDRELCFLVSDEGPIAVPHY